MTINAFFIDKTRENLYVLSSLSGIPEELMILPTLERKYKVKCVRVSDAIEWHKAEIEAGTGGDANLLEILTVALERFFEGEYDVLGERDD